MHLHYAYKALNMHMYLSAWIYKRYCTQELDWKESQLIHLLELSKLHKENLIQYHLRYYSLAEAFFCQICKNFHEKFGASEWNVKTFEKIQFHWCYELRTLRSDSISRWYIIFINSDYLSIKLEKQRGKSKLHGHLKKSIQLLLYLASFFTIYDCFGTLVTSIFQPGSFCRVFNSF